MATTRDLVLRKPRPADEDALVRLYRQAFGSKGAGRGAARAHLSRNTVVAELGGRIAGFGCYKPVASTRDEPELRQLLACLDPTTRRILGGDGLPLPIRIEAPEGVAPPIEVGDRVFTALAVHPDLQRQGIGTALVKARLGLAHAAGAKRVFVHCIAGAGSRPLYESLGFVPLVTTDLHYRDGAGMTLLYRQFR